MRSFTTFFSLAVLAPPVVFAGNLIANGPCCRQNYNQCVAQGALGCGAVPGFEGGERYICMDVETQTCAQNCQAGPYGSAFKGAYQVHGCVGDDALCYDLLLLLTAHLRQWRGERLRLYELL